jgi:hypothetical protein
MTKLFQIKVQRDHPPVTCVPFEHGPDPTRVQLTFAVLEFRLVLHIWRAQASDLC